MPLDEQKYRSPATRGQVAGVALHAGTAILQIKWALLELQKGADISRSISAIEESQKKLDEMFDELTGWKPDDVG